MRLGMKWDGMGKGIGEARRFGEGARTRGVREGNEGTRER